MFDQARADAICARLAEGESLRKASASQGVAHSSVLEWEDTIPAFADQYAQARSRGYRILADQIIEISDDSSGDVIDTDNGPKADPEFAARSRLRIDSRKWMLSKMLPKLYGEKLDLNHGGSVNLSIAEAVRSFNARCAGDTDVLE